MNIAKRWMLIARLEGRKEGRMMGRIEGKREGIVEGIVEGMVEGIIEGERMAKKSIVISLIRETDFSEEKVADLVEVPVYFVRKMKKKMASRN